MQYALEQHVLFDFLKKYFSDQTRRSMKKLAILFLLVLISCESDKKKSADEITEDTAVITREIIAFHQALKQAYNGAPIHTDSLMDNLFDRGSSYVTYWGITEPIDSTKSRLRRAVPGIKNYDNHLESIMVKVYNDGAYAFFILRQTYMLNGVLMEEYLPTTYVFERRHSRWKIVHAHRSADFQTIDALMDVARIPKESSNTEAR
jgi:hypothetical protein